ncbi:YbjN domain-containing protein [Dactylosporangium sp. CA-233914]|uniref:YbjN domain-containing protein n=1 Tax=Dactylosporangium sp. CA-233914 TaxID=3239934 RepID=UPI003D94BF40
MPRWPWRTEPSSGSKTDSIVAQLTREDATLTVDGVGEAPPEDSAGEIAPITLLRVAEALEKLEIRYLTDGDGSLLALWERHAVLFALEGPSDEILVIRARPHATVPPDWADRSYRVVNEWNHTRRFYKAYVGDPTDRGQLPIYAEMQVPLLSGVHDTLVAELVDCAAVVALGFVDWLHDEGALL